MHLYWVWTKIHRKNFSIFTCSKVFVYALSLVSGPATCAPSFLPCLRGSFLSFLCACDMLLKVDKATEPADMLLSY